LARKKNADEQLVTCGCLPVAVFATVQAATKPLLGELLEASRTDDVPEGSLVVTLEDGQVRVACLTLEPLITTLTWISSHAVSLVDMKGPRPPSHSLGPKGGGNVMASLPTHHPAYRGLEGRPKTAPILIL
jgi:hypothetical protein